MDFLNNLFKYENETEISGLTEELCNIYINNLYHLKNKNIIVVTNSLYEANRFYNNLAIYEQNLFLFPMDDFLSSMIVAESPDLKYKRLETIDKLKNKEQGIILTNLLGFLKYLPSINIQNSIKINPKMNIKRDDFVNKLYELGYQKSSLVTQTGEIAVRGFIVDVYPLDEVHPLRVEFDGNVIDSIRYFDEDTQISYGPKNNLVIK